MEIWRESQKMLILEMIASYNMWGFMKAVDIYVAGIYETSRCLQKTVGI